MKTGAVIQARMQSTRLPGKVLLPLPFPSGVPLISHIVDRCNFSKRIDQVIIATSKKKENDLLAEHAINNHCKLFRGSEDYVLERFFLACKENDFDVVVRLTADNPCVDTAIMDQLIERHILNKNDYTRSVGLPVGMNFEIISFSALAKAFSEATAEDEKEHVTPYIIKNPSLFKTEKVSFESPLSTMRLTVDYPSDYAMVAMLFSLLSDVPFFGIHEIEQAVINYPWIKEINAGNFQKRTFDSKMQELQAAVEQLNVFEMYNASAILKDQLK